MTKWYLGVTMTGEDLQATLDSENITGYTLHENGKVRVAVYVEDIPADVMAEQQARAVEASA